MTITTTQTDRYTIRQAQAKGLALVENGAVNLMGGTGALVSDGTLLYYADATGCGCSTLESRGGHACSHQWAGRYALDAGKVATTADRETAA